MLPCSLSQCSANPSNTPILKSWGVVKAYFDTELPRNLLCSEPLSHQCPLTAQSSQDLNLPIALFMVLISSQN